MAEVLVQISGVLYDKLSRTERPVLLQGAASLVGLGVGGGPLPGGGPVDPGYGVPAPIDPGYGVRPPVDPGYGVRPPVDPGYGVRPPVDPGYGVPGGEHPMPPIYYPPQVPPEMKPPETPPPGTVTPVPPPPGSGGWPTQGMVPPEYIVVRYPGVGPVVVTAPPHAEPAS